MARMPDHAARLRQQLADHTRAAHEALHHHPLLSRMLAADLSLPEYRACLRAHLAFTLQAEAAHRATGLPPEFGFSDDLAALAADLGVRPTFSTAPMGRLQGFGWLYVAHGAQFGRQVMAASVARSLPDAPRRFLCQRQPPQIWRELLAQISRSAGLSQTDTLLSGADSAFAAMKTAADAEFEGFPSVV